MSSANVSSRRFSLFPMLKTADCYKPHQFKVLFKGSYLKNRYAFGINVSDDYKAEFLDNSDRIPAAITRRVPGIVSDYYEVFVMESDGMDYLDVWYDAHFPVGDELVLLRFENNPLFRVVQQLKSVVR